MVYYFSLAILTLALGRNNVVNGFTPLSQKRSSVHMSMAKPKGSAAIPFEKNKVAVFGSGGYLGATVYGFLQRASSLYGTGLGGSASPRSICATAAGSEGLNRILGRAFKLAFAGEDMIRLTDMQSVDSIKERIKGIDAVVLGTVYQLEKRPVTANTYGKTPNDKTFEFYLDDRNLAEEDIPYDDMDTHLPIFQNSIEACKLAGVKHIVVVETPNTSSTQPFAEILDDSGIPFTFVHASGSLENTKLYSFEEGIQSDINVQGFTLAKDYTFKKGYKSGDWNESFRSEIKEGKNVLPREDLAAVVVQSLMSLDWTRSRCINVSTGGLMKKEKNVSSEYKPKKILKSDREWCMKSEILAEKLSVIE